MTSNQSKDYGTPTSLKKIVHKFKAKKILNSGSFGSKEQIKIIAHWGSTDGFLLLQYSSSVV